METNSWGTCGLNRRKAAARLFQVAAMALLVALAVPARAVDKRIVESRVAPVYPEIAKRLKITGAVHIEVTVDADGKVTDLKTISGNRAVSVAAEEAVRRWKFAPGAGVATIPVDVSFSLGD